MENRWKTQGPACIQLSKEQVTKKFDQCTHTHREAFHTSTYIPIIPTYQFVYTYKPQLGEFRLNEGAHYWARTSNQLTKGLWWTSMRNTFLSQKWVLLFKTCFCSSTTIKPETRNVLSFLQYAWRQRNLTSLKPTTLSKCLDWYKKQRVRRIIWQLSLVPGCWSVTGAFHPTLNILCC